MVVQVSLKSWVLRFRLGFKMYLLKRKNHTFLSPTFTGLRGRRSWIYVGQLLGGSCKGWRSSLVGERDTGAKLLIKAN